MDSTATKENDTLIGPPLAPVPEPGWKIWKTFLGCNSPEQVPGNHVWSYLMTHDDGRPFAWHTLAINFSGEIAKKHNSDTWYVIYVIA